FENRSKRQIIPIVNSDTRLVFEIGAKIKVLPNNAGSAKTKYSVISVGMKYQSPNNVVVINPNLKGEKGRKPGDYEKTDTEEWGGGIRTGGTNSKNIFITGAKISKMWGDGISLSGHFKNLV